MPSDKPLVAAIRTGTASFDRGDTSLWSTVQSAPDDGGREARAGPRRTTTPMRLMAAFAQVSEELPRRTWPHRVPQFDSTASSSQLTMIMVGLVAIVLGSVAAFSADALDRQADQEDADGGRCDRRRGRQSAHRRQLPRRARRDRSAFDRMTDYLKRCRVGAGKVAAGDLTASIDGALGPRRAREGVRADDREPARAGRRVSRRPARRHGVATDVLHLGGDRQGHRRDRPGDRRCG